MEVKCKHCRKNLFNNESIQLYTSHNEVKKNAMDVGCGTNDPEVCSYVSTENMPEWMEHNISQESWIKGRLHCPHCNKRIGSFNFVNESKCECGEFITLPVRITSSKVDISYDIK